MSPLAQMIQLVVLTSVALASVYFIFYRPTVDAQNRQRRVIAGLRTGDEIVTTSGFIATVVDIREPEDGPVELLLDLGDGLRVRARTSAVAERLPRPDEQASHRPPGEPAAPLDEAPPAEAGAAATVRPAPPPEARARRS